MNPTRLFKVLVLVFTLVGTRVVAEPLPSGHVRVMSGDAELTTHEGKQFTLPVGTHILDGTTWQNLDSELVRAHNAETRYQAENKSLKGALNAPGITWGSVIVLTLLVATVGGTAYYLDNR